MGYWADKIRCAGRGVDFDDVALRPALTDIDPTEVSLRETLGGIQLRYPFVAAAMDHTSSVQLAVAAAQSGGVAILPRWHRNDRIRGVKAVRKVRPLPTATVANDALAVGVTVAHDEVALAVDLAVAGASLIMVDSANGAQQSIRESVRSLRSRLPNDVTLGAGNVVTSEGALALFEAGARIVKVGLGVGSICTTTAVTGFGYPQLEAIAEVADAIDELGASILAEGGMRETGDFAKALAAGATSVSLGNYFARSYEAAGRVIETDQGPMKRYAANFYRSLAYYDDTGHEVPGEGLEGLVPVEGSTDMLINRAAGALRVALAYGGARGVPDFRHNAEFIAARTRRAPAAVANPVPLRRERERPRSRFSSDQLMLFGVDDSPEVGVAIVIWKSERKELLLLGRRRDGTHALPGGHWTRGEPLSAAAEREAFEETGLIVRDSSLASVHELYDKGRQRWVVTVGFQATASDGTLHAEESGNFSELRWVSPAEALECRPIFGSDHFFLRHVMSGVIYG